MKKFVRRPLAPCAQIVNRIFEGYGSNDKGNGKTIYPQFIKRHMDGPTVRSLRNCIQFTHCQKEDCFISISQGDNCFEIKGKIGLVRNIFEDHSDNDTVSGFVIFEEFASVESYFNDPLDSACLNIYYVEKLIGLHKVYSLNDVNSKYVILPYKLGYIVMPQLHY